MPTYLEELTVRLATAVAELPDDVRARHAGYLKQLQQPDGGFPGRSGGSDLYYTGFALRSLAVLGELYGELAERAAEFLRARMTGRESIIDFFSLLYSSRLLETAAGIDIFQNAASDWRRSVAELLGQLRRADGGYAKGPEGTASSTYHTFLVLLCFELIELTPPEPHRLVEFLLSQRGVDGGFREIRASKRSGTNPTAAAIGALRILQALDEPLRQGAIEFLADMQADEGGLRANTRIPIADLLSTFTGTLTLLDLNGLPEIDVPAAVRYAKSLESSSGGFLGAEWDQACDVEYTFYGLGTLSLLAPHAALS